MLIRRYEDTDEVAVIALWSEVLADDAPHNNPATVIRAKRKVDSELFFVAVVNEIVVGTVMGGYDGHRGWVYTLAVQPKYQRQGVGSALIRRLETALQERNCLKVNLQVRSSNAGVIAFYQKLGYDIEQRVSMGKRLYRKNIASGSNREALAIMPEPTQPHRVSEDRGR